MLWILISMVILLAVHLVSQCILAQTEVLGAYPAVVLAFLASLLLLAPMLYGLVLRPVRLIYRALKDGDSWVCALGDHGLPLGFFLNFAAAVGGLIAYDEASFLLGIMLVLKGVYEVGKRGAIRAQHESRRFWNNLFRAMHEGRLPFPEADNPGRGAASNPFKRR